MRSYAVHQAYARAIFIRFQPQYGNEFFIQPISDFGELKRQTIYTALFTPLLITIVHRQVAIQPIFMRLVLKINLSLVLPVMIHKIINLLSGTYLIFIYTKYSYSSSLKV